MKQLILYCICGGLGVLSDMIVFYLAIMFGIGYQWANAGGYLAGTLVSFVLNRKITFAMPDQIIRRLVLFLAVAATGYLASALLLWILVDLTRIDAVYAKVLTLPLVVILQFTLNRWITFRKPRPATSV